MQFLQLRINSYFWCRFTIFNYYKMEASSENITYLIDNLTERRKELNCIYQVNEILRDYSVDIESVFREILLILPEAWRYSEICHASIIYNDDIYETCSFKKSKLKLSANIIVDGNVTGEIQVYYTKPVTNDKGIFLPEEQKLLNTVAEKLSSFILLKKLKESINKQKGEKKFNETSSEHTIIDWLKGAGLTEKEALQLLRIKINFRKGETICKQGALNTYIMLMDSGLAKAYLEGYQDKGLNFKIIQPYDFIGLTSIKGSDYYRFSVSAITPCTLYLIDKDEFISIVDNNSVLSNYLIEWYCKFTGHIFSRLHCVSNKQAPGRVADVLLYLSSGVFNSKQISSVISRKDIAELAGMSTESAVRILSELKNDGIIKVSKAGIELLKPDLIKTISLAG